LYWLRKLGEKFVPIWTGEAQSTAYTVFDFGISGQDFVFEAFW
jgi:hypothetical protein